MIKKAGQDKTSWYFSNIDETLALASALFDEHGQHLLANQDVADGLARLRCHEADLQEQMRAMDMGSRCGQCAARAGGGCCSAYMGGNADSVLLLINLLLHTDVRFQHDNGVDCRYLGQTGCILPIKPIFCLNYNCTHIKNAATETEMTLLDQRAATLLSAQRELETLLVDLLDQCGS